MVTFCLLCPLLLSGADTNTLYLSLIHILATLAGVLYMMLSISVWMTLVALVMLPISVGLISTVVKKSQKHFVGQQKYLGNVNGHKMCIRDR